MAPSVPLQACFRKWSGLDCVESCLIVSSAVLKVLISAHHGDWLRVKCALMNTNLQCGLGLSGICWVSESGGQVIRLRQVYQCSPSSARDACGDAQALCFLPGGIWSITAAAVCVPLPHLCSAPHSLIDIWYLVNAQEHAQQKRAHMEWSWNVCR